MNLNKNNKLENNSKISIITVSLNAGKTLSATIESVINQTYRNIEYIIVDGASTDNTIDIIEKYESKIDYWISEPDDGIYDAMNKAVRFVTGEWIIFMNAGDAFYGNSVCEMFSNFIRDDVDIYYGDICLDGTKIIKGPKTLSPFFFRMERMITHQAIFARSKLFTVRKFNTKYRIVADRDWLTFFYQNNYKIKHISLIVCIYDTHGVSSNTEKYQKDSSKLIKNSFGNFGLVFIIIKRFMGKILRSLGFTKYL